MILFPYQARMTKTPRPAFFKDSLQQPIKAAPSNWRKCLVQNLS
jgi:hypothetical protein